MKKDSFLKNIPNRISVSRIIFSLLLLLAEPLSALFFLIYAICGLSDVLDGYLARKMRVASPLGARLDSIGDIVFTIVLLIILIPIIDIPIQILAVIIIIALIRIISIIAAYCKYKKFVAGLHTYANKAAGFILFCYPGLICIIDMTSATWIVCLVPLYSSIEELIINLTSKELNVDTKSLFRNNK